MKQTRWMPILPWVGWATFIFGLFGVRGVISNTLYTDLLKNPLVLLVLKPIYYISLVFSIGLFAFVASQQRSRLESIVKAVRRNILLIAAIVASATPFIFFVITKRLYLDFWLDEVISIRRHIVTTIDQALFWYPIPNNHVFTNALSGIYLQLLGGKNLLAVFENPQVLRFMYLIFGLSALFFSALFAFRFVSKTTSLIVVLLWTTCIAFLNFAAQARGYAPTLFFESILLLAVWQYRKQAKPATGAVILLFSAFLIYTIPSNLYLLGGMILFFGISGLLDFFKQSQHRAVRWLQSLLAQPAISISLLIGFGCLLAVLFYLPIINKVLGNKYVEAIRLFQGTALSLSFWEITTAFISERWILFALALVGLVATFVPSKSRERYLGLVVFLVFAIFLPFLLSFIRGDDPPPRTFLFNMPAFFLLTAIGLEGLIEAITFRANSWLLIRPVVLIFLLGYANLVFFSHYQQISDTVQEVLVSENVDFIEYHDERLEASVYLDHYSIRDVIKEFMAQAEPMIPVFVDGNNTRYDFTLTTYLDTYEIDYETVTDMASINGSRVYFFLSYPDKSLRELQAILPQAECSLVTLTLSIYRAVDCTLQ